MRVIVPVPLGWQSSLPIQMTRSPNASLRAIAVFMTMPPDDRPRKNEDRWAATLGDGTAFPLWRVIAHQSMFGYRPPEHLARLQCSTLHQVPFTRSCSRGRDVYRLTCFVFRCRI